ncbi:hypothetical protein [Paracoccus yeei]|uniref:hypothetical protein n=1 Tax=Paracoccus yeei TaxID=147645 RepID=UPI0011B0A780|nr:hypothetical protein [Paracoccus yeei]
MTEHSCPGSREIARLTTEQCNGDAECAVSVLLLASAIAGMKAGLSVGEMAHELMGLVIAAEILSGVDRRKPS